MSIAADGRSLTTSRSRKGDSDGSKNGLTYILDLRYYSAIYRITFMTIDFGSIKGYNPERGFGFVGHTFFNPDGKVFFHIKKIKKKYPELAQNLDSGEAFETVNFWYEIETTEKGEQVSKLWLNANNIPPSYTNELCGLKQKVESIWKNIGSPKPSWLDHVTIELVGVNRRHELSVERDNLESQLRAAEEERRREAEALLQNEIVKIAKKYGLDTAKVDEILSIAKKYDLDITKVYEILKIAKKYGLDAAKVDEILRIAKKYDLDAAEVDEILRIAKRYRLDTTRAYELYRLLKELGPLGFTHSRQLSIHIIRYKLGYRYPHISGIVTMEDGGTAWEFPGGFPPEIYTIICMELRLANQGTSARAIGFTPFKDIY